MSSCNHAMAQEIKGPPPRFRLWLCMKQLYLVQEIPFHCCFERTDIIESEKDVAQMKGSLACECCLAIHRGQCSKGKVIHTPYLLSGLRNDHGLVLSRKK